MPKGKWQREEFIYIPTKSPSRLPFALSNNKNCTVIFTSYLYRRSLTMSLVSDQLASTEVKEKDKRTETTESSKYSVFSTKEKYLVLIITGTISFWSSVSTPIYYPALQIIENHFNISEELVNISIVVYMLAQGTAPMVSAGLADHYGRRPLLICSLVAYIGASIGLALCNSYGLLLGLRIVQSASIAPTVAISSGVVGDYTQRAERGGYIGLISGLTLMGQAFGSLIGAALAAAFGWRGIFWFMAIGAAASLSWAIFLLPETNRSIVGNASIVPKSWINRAPILLYPTVKRNWHLDDPDLDSLTPTKNTDYAAPFKILSIPEITICLFAQALAYIVWTVVLTDMTTQLSKNYHYSVMKIGLCYLPGGIGGLIGSVTSGKILDWNYRRNFKQFEKDKASGKISQDATFNIIKARVQVSVPYLLLSHISSIIFGWCIFKQLNISSIIITSTFVSYGAVGCISASTTLLVDLYPSKSSSSTSAINFSRCMLAAVFIAALSKMNNAMTVGGALTLIASVGILSTVSLFIPVKYAPEWQRKREIKRERKRADTEMAVK